MEDMKLKDPKKYDNVVMGGFKSKADGLILTNWELGDFPDVKSEFAIDFGFSNDPSALIECYINHGKKTLYVKQRLYSTGIIPSKLAEITKNITGRSLIIADSASPDIIGELANKNCNIIPVKKPKIIQRLELLRDYFIIVDPDSTDIIEELNEYCWDSNYPMGDRPIDNFNHAIDAINYYVVHRGRKKKFNMKSIR
jgi:phage terminase large subunit